MGNPGTLSLRRRFLLGKWDSNYSARAEIPRTAAPELIDGLCRVVLTPLLHAVSDGHHLRDMKGRDAGAPLSLSVEHPPIGEEILFCSGEIAGGEDGKERSYFEVRLSSRFDAFAPGGHILHSVREVRAGSLPDYIPWSSLGRICPVELHTLRIGVDFFETQSISASLGFAPSVKQQLLVEYVDTRLHVEIVSEELERRDSLPLTRHALIHSLSDTLEDFLGFKLADHYAQLATQA